MEQKKRRKLKEKARKIKAEIKQEVLLNIPNSLTILRILLVFIAVYMLFSGFSRLSVAIVFAIAAITDTLDGQLARLLKQTTKIGARLDQISDRLFAIVIVIALVVYFSRNDNGSILFVFMAISREIVGFPGLIIRIMRGKDTYSVKYIGKATTVLQFTTFSFLIAGFSFSFYFVIVTFLLGILSGFDYLRESVN